MCCVEQVDNMSLLIFGGYSEEDDEWGCCHENCIRGNATTDSENWEELLNFTGDDGLL